MVNNHIPRTKPISPEHPPPSRSTKPTKPEDDTLILEVRLASGRFSSSIHVPLFASAEDKQRFVESWVNLMDAGIKCGQSARENRDDTGSSKREA